MRVSDPGFVYFNTVYSKQYNFHIVANRLLCKNSVGRMDFCLGIKNVAATWVGKRKPGKKQLSEGVSF